MLKLIHKWIQPVFVFFLSLSLSLSAFCEIALSKYVTGKIEPEILACIENQSRINFPNPPYDEIFVRINSVVRGDINGDKQEDAFVSYGVAWDNGDAVDHYMVLFIRSGNGLNFIDEVYDRCIVWTSDDADYSTTVPVKIEMGRILCDVEHSGTNKTKEQFIIYYKNGHLVQKNKPVPPNPALQPSGPRATPEVK